MNRMTGSQSAASPVQWAKYLVEAVLKDDPLVEECLRSWGRCDDVEAEPQTQFHIEVVVLY
eukprot:6945825-Pyramimonas_sp.AAC.2